MSDVTHILARIDSGDLSSADQLLPLVYEELRKLAAARLSHEKPGQTLQATALVHEAYLRLVGNESNAAKWDSRGHFFAAAAEAMRRILVDAARRKKSLRRGGEYQRQEMNEDAEHVLPVAESLLDLDAALDKLRAMDPAAADLVQLRFFAGLTIEDAANALGISPRTAKRNWAYARAWLRRELGDDEG